MTDKYQKDKYKKIKDGEDKQGEHSMSINGIKGLIMIS